MRIIGVLGSKKPQGETLTPKAWVHAETYIESGAVKWKGQI